MVRTLSGIQPSGPPHLGNYLGALRQWVALQGEGDALFCIVDLHALTLDIDPVLLANQTRETAACLLAVGLDPDVCTLFYQSYVAEHTELAWLLECTATFGELNRMTQFKAKSEGRESVRIGLMTYPVLMAADILFYNADRVPVGDDQRQHLELARDLAERFNMRYGATFTVPEAAIPTVGARVMDLQHPTNKMSKSADSPLGTVLITDPPNEIEHKIKRAVTDTDNEVRFDLTDKPGVSNLLELLGATIGADPKVLAEKYENYGSLKADVAAAVIEMLAPIQQRLAEITADRALIDGALNAGAARARERAQPMMAKARAAVGLLAKP